jgi:sigma-54 dependent transcriptional regulator, acetoin dehydrogenase operon transcriptional activator AcoR
VKKLYILTWGQDQCDIMHAQLKEFFGEDVEIVAITVDGIEKIDYTDGLVVFSAEWVENYAREKGKIDPDLDYIVAQRVINYNHIDKLVQLNDGEDVLVCSDSEAFSNRMIDQLKEFGLNSINFIPCLFNTPNSKNVKTAIVFTSLGQLPAGVEKVIDLGARMLSIASVVEILERLNLIKEKESMILFQFITKLMDVLVKHKENYSQLQEIRSLYSTIVNNISEGIIYTDTAGKILVVNQATEIFFQKGRILTVGNNIRDYFPEVTNLLDSDFERQIVSCQGHEVALSKKAVVKDEKLIGSVYLIEDTRKIIIAEQNIRLRNLRSEVSAQYYFEDIIYKSPKIGKVIELAKEFALSEDTILIQGESGTGKELFAQAIHNYSPRCKGPFVAVNLASLTETLLESELFGYEEGSFTGAQKGGKRGLFERAHGGTIFIDEIGDVSLAFQSRLLRVLQERQLKPVGSTTAIPVDIRVIAASNLDLWAEVENNNFRKDLFFRLNVLPITIPSLRDRREDIPVLLKYYLGESYSLQSVELENLFSSDALAGLIGYNWPGNVRELCNMVKYLGFVIRRGRRIELEDLNFYDRQSEALCPEMFWILEKIESNSGAGRYFLADEARKEGLDISEGQIRLLNKKLENEGYLQVNIGAKGAVLTGKAKRLLQKA